MTTTAQEAGGHAAAREILEAKERITAPAVRPLTPWMILAAVMAERDRLAIDNAQLRALHEERRASHAEEIARLEGESAQRHASAWTWKGIAEDYFFERDEARAAYRDAQDMLEKVAAERDHLVERRDALLKLVRDLSQSTPLASELEGWERQRAALIAEVGTLRARVEEHATIAEGACRMLVEVQERIEVTCPRVDGEPHPAEQIANDIFTFLSAPGHDVPGLRAQVAARDCAIDALTERVRKLLAWQAETEHALTNFGATLAETDEAHARADQRALTWELIAGALLYHLAFVADELEDVAESPSGRFVGARLGRIVERTRKLVGQALTESGTTEGT